MKERIFQQFEIVAADSPRRLTEQLNMKLYELRGKHPAVTFEGMIARISYDETEEEPEDLSDEYQAKGVNLKCERCPYFQPVRKADGTIDERAKWGECPATHYGRTRKESPVCERFFEELNIGHIRLTF